MILYRTPYSDTAVKISDGVTTLNNLEELRNRKGFVMIPYSLNSSHPIYLFEGKQETVSINTTPVTTEEHLHDVEADKPAYEAAFHKFMDTLQLNRFEKLVLSRTSTVRWEYSVEGLTQAFHLACRKYPRLFIYLAIIPEEGAWLGCTPEILISGERNHYRTMALAGTMSLPPETAVKDIRWSEKNRQEQEIVADYIRQCILPFSDVIEEEGPYTSHAGHLVHLKTEFHFTPRPNFNVIDAIKTLHPTPAVCGLPAKEAASFIQENEGYDRSYYSGVVGYIGETTNLFVNLRCANITPDNTAHLYAGGGILKDSTLESEWNETKWKTQTVLSLNLPL